MRALPKASPPSPGLLFGAIGSAAVSVVLGILLGRGSGPVALFAWFLAGFVSIGLMALHQQQDLKAAMSVYYVADASSNLYRWIAIGLGAVGVVLNSYFFAQWVATR